MSRFANLVLIALSASCVELPPNPNPLARTNIQTSEEVVLTGARAMRWKHDAQVFDCRAASATIARSRQSIALACVEATWREPENATRIDIFAGKVMIDARNKETILIGGVELRTPAGVVVRAERAYHDWVRGSLNTSGPAQVLFGAPAP